MNNSTIQSLLSLVKKEIRELEVNIQWNTERLNIWWDEYVQHKDFPYAAEDYFKRYREHRNVISKNKAKIKSLVKNQKELKSLLQSNLVLESQKREAQKAIDEFSKKFGGDN